MTTKDIYNHLNSCLNDQNTDISKALEALHKDEVLTELLKELDPSVPIDVINDKSFINAELESSSKLKEDIIKTIISNIKQRQRLT